MKAVEWIALRKRVVAWLKCQHPASLGRLRGDWYPVASVGGWEVVPRFHGAAYRPMNSLNVVTAIIPLNIVIGLWVAVARRLRAHAALRSGAPGIGAMPAQADSICPISAATSAYAASSCFRCAASSRREQ